MTNEALTTVKTNIENSISQYDTKYNRKRIFRRAWYLVRTKGLTFSEALKQVWNEWKISIENSRKEVAALKIKLMNLFTPKQYIETAEGIQECHYNLMNNR